MKWLQTRVGVTADGLWGPDTETAFTRFSDGPNLTVDGDTGPNTVKALQRHLMLMTGTKLTIDGAWGATTTRALQTALNQGRF
ncbi:hypothetical protein AAGT00_12435 [Streptomyces cavourensis]